MEGPINFHIHGRDVEESDDEEEAAPLPRDPLSRTQARGLGKEGLKSELDRYLLFLTDVTSH